MHGKKEADTETEKLISMTSGGFVCIKCLSLYQSQYIINIHKPIILTK